LVKIEAAASWGRKTTSFRAIGRVSFETFAEMNLMGSGHNSEQIRYPLKVHFKEMIRLLPLASSLISWLNT